MTDVLRNNWNNLSVLTYNRSCHSASLLVQLGDSVKMYTIQLSGLIAVALIPAKMPEPLGGILH